MRITKYVGHVEKGCKGGQAALLIDVCMNV